MSLLRHNYLRSASTKQIQNIKLYYKSILENSEPSHNKSLQDSVINNIIFVYSDYGSFLFFLVHFTFIRYAVYANFVDARDIHRLISVKISISTDPIPKRNI